MMKSTLLILLLATASAFAQNTGISLYLEEGKSGSVWGLALSRDGSLLYSCGRDSTAKAWSTKNGECRRTYRAEKPTLITCLALAPDQRTLAVGDMNGVVSIFETGSGQLRKSFTGHAAYILAIAFSTDGSRLVTAGRDDAVNFWDAASWEKRGSIAAGSIWVNDIAVSPDGKTLLTAGQDGSVKLWDAAAGTLIAPLGMHNRFTRCVRFSPDGQFGLSGGRDGVVKVWNIAARAEQTEFTLEDGFAHHIAFDGDGETAYISMMNNCIEAWNWRKGLRVQRYQPESYGAMNAVYSPITHRLYSAHTSGAISVWNAETRALLVTMVGFSDGQWLTYTIDGYFDCSTYGDRYVQWRKGADLYPLELYEAEYHQPGIIEDALAGTYSPTGAITTLVDPPTLEFLAPRQNQLFAFGSEPLDVVVEVEARDRRAVTQIEVAVNGRPVVNTGDRNAAVVSVKDGVMRMSMKVRVLPGLNTIEAAAYNASRVKSDPVRRVITVETDQKLAPNLFVLTVGIDKYAPVLPDLNYASNDAEALAGAFAAQEGRLYSRVYVKTLVNKEATRAAIQKAIADFPPMNSQDMLVMFFSGHGVRLKDAKGRIRYYYVAAGAQKKTIDKTGLAWDEFARQIEKVRAGRVILLLDACHSGAVSEGASNERVASTLARDLGIVFSSSSGGEFSYENSAWRHGAFTLAMLQALSGDADFTKNNTVDWSEFQLYVISKVRELTGDNQNPMIPRLEQFSNFDFVRVR